jgi:class 3 adenylate cyclase
VSSVIGYGTYARVRWAPDFAHGWDDDFVERFSAGLRDAGAEGAYSDVVVPSRRGDQRFREWFARLCRQAASPSMAMLYLRANVDIDIRELLPSLRVPVLVIHRTGDRLVRVELGRDLATRIPGARFVELDGGDHWPWFGDSEAVVEEVEEFVTGVRHAPATDRVLATVLFTDIVGSTEHVARLGDSAWKRVLDEHDSLIVRQVERFRGRTVEHTGDGVLATFDGPARAVQCARTIQEASHAIGVEVRAGLHAGECERRGDDIGGLAVHIGARVAALAGPGEILVSSTVRDLVVGSGIEFTDRGQHELKGVPGEWRLYGVAAL